jgi:hypothetical protein
MLLSTGIARQAVFAGREDVLGRVGRNQSDRWKLDDARYMMRHGGWQAAYARQDVPPSPSAAPPQAPPAPAPDVANLAARLRDLARLRSDGALTDAEFSAEKTRLLEG